MFWIFSKYWKNLKHFWNFENTSTYNNTWSALAENSLVASSNLLMVAQRLSVSPFKLCIFFRIASIFSKCQSDPGTETRIQWNVLFNSVAYIQNVLFGMRRGEGGGDRREYIFKFVIILKRLPRSVWVEKVN